MIFSSLSYCQKLFDLTLKKLSSRLLKLFNVLSRTSLPEIKNDKSASLKIWRVLRTISSKLLHGSFNDRYHVWLKIVIEGEWLWLVNRVFFCCRALLSGYRARHRGNDPVLSGSGPEAYKFLFFDEVLRIQDAWRYSAVRSTEFSRLIHHKLFLQAWYFVLGLRNSFQAALCVVAVWSYNLAKTK